LRRNERKSLAVSLDTTKVHGKGNEEGREVDLEEKKYK